MLLPIFSSIMRKLKPLGLGMRLKYVRAAIVIDVAQRNNVRPSLGRASDIRPAPPPAPIPATASRLFAPNTRLGTT